MADVPEWLGKIIPADAVVGRDAFHIACAPVVAGCKLSPGERVELHEGKAVEDNGLAIGIVDPLLEQDVWPGERCWLLLFPGTITGLRHVWSHPSFDAKVPEDAIHPPSVVSSSRKWLENIAPQFDVDYDELMRIAEAYQTCGDIVTEQGSDGWRDTFYSVDEEFWRHYEIVTGKKVKDTGSPFSCSC